MSRIELWVLSILLVVSCTQASFAQAEQNISFLMSEASQSVANGHFKHAERTYQSVLRQDANNASAILGLAISLRAQGKASEATPLLENLISQRPDYQPAYYLLGLIYESQGDMSRARQAYKTYVALAPQNIPPNPEIRLKLRQVGVF